MSDDETERLTAAIGARVTPLYRALPIAGLAASSSAARRCIMQGGVTVNGKRETDPTVGVREGARLTCGRAVAVLGEVSAPTLYALAMLREIAPSRAWRVDGLTVTDGRLFVRHSTRGDVTEYVIDAGGAVPVRCPVDDLSRWLPAAIERTSLATE